MFTPFFYLLRAKGLDVSLTEWLTLMEALNKELSQANLTDFYYLSRMCLVKSETDFDKFDQAFDEFFKQIKTVVELPEHLRRWLEDTKKKDENPHFLDDEESYLGKRRDREFSHEDIEKMFKNRMEEQKEKHDGGKTYIGTGGTSAFGHNGLAPDGIRVSGRPGMHSAFQVIGEKRYRDFRLDKALSYRQFQVAFRRLRQYSSRLDIPKTELDLDKTVESTCKQGGFLKLEMTQPRKNTVKLLLLFDSGGTMIPHMQLCNNLFKAVDKANHFKDVKIYYFHNCIYSHVYKTPECLDGDWVKSEWIFHNLDEDYRVVVVGDMQMAPEEFLAPDGNYRGPNMGLSGKQWVELYMKHFKKIVWLNPSKHDYAASMDWMLAEATLTEMIPTYKLTVDGLNQAIKKLMVNR